jgi:hypothetical protein
MSNALANKQGALAPLRAADPKDVLNRVLNEESTKDIAASFGVTRSALNQWLLSNAEDDWKAAQVIRAFKRKEEAEEALDNVRTELEGLSIDDAEGKGGIDKTNASTSLSLARLRACEASLKSAQWDLERVCRRIYGQDAPPQGVNAVQININLNRKPLDVVVEHNSELVIDQDAK